MAADGLLTQETRASTAMVLNKASWNIPPSVPVGSEISLISWLLQGPATSFLLYVISKSWGVYVSWFRHNECWYLRWRCTNAYVRLTFSHFEVVTSQCNPLLFHEISTERNPTFPKRWHSRFSVSAHINSTHERVSTIMISISLLLWFTHALGLFHRPHVFFGLTPVDFYNVSYFTLMAIIWGVMCQKQVSRAGTGNYIPQILWDVIT